MRSTKSYRTRRNPGKLSNVRSSRNSSSRNIAGSPAPVRLVEKKSSVTSNAARAPDADASVTGKGDRSIAAR